jgi:hypothetical protein
VVFIGWLGGKVKGPNEETAGNEAPGGSAKSLDSAEMGVIDRS